MQFDLLLASVKSLFQRDPQVVAQIRSASVPSSGTAAAEKVLKDPVASPRGSEHLTKEVEGIVKPTSSRRGPLKCCVAVAVVGGALLLITHDVVGFSNFPETGLRLDVAGILVRMMLHRQFAVRALDLLEFGGAADFQHLIAVPLGHAGSGNLVHDDACRTHQTVG